MKIPKLLPTIVLFAMLSFSCSTDSMDEAVASVATNLEIPEAKPVEIEILELINNFRISEGLNPLRNLDIIKTQTYSHTDYMIEQDNVSHDNFYSRKSFLVNNAGAKKVSENVAYGFTSAESVVNAWLNSEGHRDTIEGDFTDFDISAEQNESGQWYYTNIFLKK